MPDNFDKGRLRDSHGVQSAETVLEVLSAFNSVGPLPMLKTLAERTNMHPAKVHRYLVSLCRMGYVEQDEMTSRYRLGPASLRLSFAAMESIDAIRVARPMMAGFCHRLQETVVLGVWNVEGPTIAIRETLPGLLIMMAREGYVLPILRSSIGTIFGSWLPRERTQALIDAELANISDDESAEVPRTPAEVDETFAETRRRGLARTVGQLNAATRSLAAPIFDASGQIAAVLCALGPRGQFDTRWESPTAKILLKCADEVSHGLGFYEDARRVPQR